MQKDGEGENETRSGAPPEGEERAPRRRMGLRISPTPVTPAQAGAQSQWTGTLVP